MPESPQDHLQNRFARVIAHIDENAERPLGLAELAGIAAYSPFHFHRQFAALFDISATKYVRLVRMRRAAHSLLFRKDIPVTDIAFDAGFENAESFSRAFRKLHDQSPSDFRSHPDWDNWQAPYAKLQQVRRDTMTNEVTSSVTIIDFPETRTACMDHIGPPARIGETIQRFIAWRKIHHLHPSKHATFNIVWCNPDDTPPDAFRMGLAVVTDQELSEEDKHKGLYAQTLPAGRYAKLRHVGSDQTLGDSALALYRDWLPQSGETPGDFPLIFQRIAFYPDVAEHEAITDILLPLA
ncbi:AraC family transcriptional regulator [Thalassospira sp.]|uniref:AraC family transcriptional regulator n=1 Tax=Thalassospira sp. TaxID=1912094 RepID=UPI000C54E1CA|nr:AraC family transcriptional regulator [Thalassospira sp.]MBC05829.1 AraC family transcriptional regulator [Thalassospira sp.]|tara:strand:- start:880 stop:1767 length:888 start_codon:yes stop_codon:yes gene_type:complete